MRILQAHLQIGLPTSVNTDGELGWALYAYTSTEILMNHCQGAQSLPPRVEGVCSKGSEALKSELAQRAKCGICPCCALATHVLVPATYDAGRFDRKKANTTQLWQRFGPMAIRNYAAAVYRNLYGPLPASWNWIASKHLVRLPPPLNPEDCRAADEVESQLALDDERRSRARPLPQSPAPSSFSPAPQPPNNPKPPPPIYPARAAPSPAQSSCPSKGDQSYGEWESRRDPPLSWSSRQRRR